MTVINDLSWADIVPGTVILNSGPNGKKECLLVVCVSPDDRDITLTLMGDSRVFSRTVSADTRFASSKDPASHNDSFAWRVLIP